MSPGIPRALAARLHRVHEAQERVETANLLAAGLGDEAGVTTRTWPGGIWAVRSSAAPNHQPGNQVMGITEESLDLLPEVLGWFAETGSRLHLRWPAADLPDGHTRLAAFGLRAYEVEAWMAAPIAELTVDAPEHEIIEVATDAELAHWLATFVAGWEVADPGMQRIAKAAMGAWPAPPGWRRFLARVDGEPAGEALLVQDGELAYLAEASTRPSFRRRGIQRALIQRRIEAARASGATVLFGGVAYGDGSWSNMRAMGLREEGVTITFVADPKA